MSQEQPPWSGIILTVVGIAFSLFALYSFLANRDLSANGLRTQGIVVDLVATDDSDGEARYAPVIEWIDQAGIPHRLTGSVASSPPAFVVTQNVVVLYNPSDPTQARIDNPMEAYLVVFLFGSMGVVFSFLGLSKVLPWLKQRKTAASNDGFA